MQSSTTQTNQQNPVNPQELVKNQQVEANRLDKVPVKLGGVIEQNYWDQLTIEQKQLLMTVEKLPSQLNGIVPESVWSTLSVNQRLEFLFEKNLIPRTNLLAEKVQEGPYFEQEKDTQMEQMEKQLSPSHTQEEPAIKGEVNIVEEQKSETEFSEAVSEFEKVAGESETEKPQEPQQTVETPMTQPSAELPPSKPKNEVKLHGYGVSEKVTNDLESQMNGDVDKSSTWAATIVAKLLGIFG